MEKTIDKVLFSKEDILQIALQHHQQGRFLEAKALYEKILTLNPSHYDALHLMGVLSYQNNQYHEAKRYISQAIMLQPKVALYQMNLGNVFLAMGDYEQAEKYFLAGLALKPDEEQLIYNYAGLLQQASRHKEAVDYYKKIKNTNYLLDSLNNLGVSLIALKEYKEAIIYLEKAKQLNPRHFNVLVNLGIALQEDGQLNKALEVNQQALMVNGRSSSAWNNDGSILYELGDLNAARNSISCALQYDTNNSKAYFNLGNIEKAEGAIDKAIEAYSTAINLDVNYHDAFFNRSLCHFLLGKYDLAWADYSHRWQANCYFQTERPLFKIADWKGESIKGLSLLIWGEQGLGDQVFLCKMLKEIPQDAHRVVVAVHKKLVSILSRTYPDIEFVDDLSKIEQNEFDYQCALGNLGFILAYHPKSTVPEPYLIAHHDLSKQYRQQFELLAEGREIVGVSWATLNQEAESAHAVSLTEMIKPYDSKSCLLVNLQYGCFDDSELLEVKVSDENMEGWLAALQACDKIVTIDNALAHFSGALGKQTEVILPKRVTHYWGGHNGQCFWYPSCHISCACLAN